MKTKEELQTAVDELREVCKKHDIVLIGTCSSEGIYGEITIGEATQSAIAWDGIADMIDTEVVEDDLGAFVICGIGDLRDE